MQCPFCKEQIHEEAIKCKHCGSILNQASSSLIIINPEAGFQEQPIHTASAAQQVPPSGFMADEAVYSRPFFSKEYLAFLYLNSRGRINRQRYWVGMLFLVILMGILSALLEAGQSSLSGIVFLLHIYPYCMLVIKRAHDLNKSGHFCWLLLIPIVSLYPNILFAFFRGTAKENFYGIDPLQNAN